MNLNYESFVQLTSTCKALRELENDEAIMRKVCNINNKEATIEQCITTVKYRKNEEKVEKEREKNKQLEVENNKINCEILKLKTSFDVYKK
jgi:hypothetical protein